MEIKTIKELKRIIVFEQEVYRKAGYKNKFISLLMQNDVGKIVGFLYALRHEEYWLYKSRHSKGIMCFLSEAMSVAWRAKKQARGGKMGLFIPAETVGYGLWILHSGNVIINGKARIGNNCIFSGMNCIGTDHPCAETASFPSLGDNVFLGVGASIIGGVSLADGIVVAAGAVVTKSCDTDGAILAGVPARNISEKKD